ncbi:disease resistance protein RPS4B-like [Tripterygium wilfordii]|uniref:disease resistance protein RPS4B-like n=1 Tax=Tripterygium wilfordii TaxID=458696 RepID=UPI0018F7F6B1|nr:disease resistance protein RPS4B-like [Tripterygium wilfordii]
MLDSNVEQLWDGRQNLVHLKEIVLTSSSKLIEIPDLSLATNLEYLELGRCFLIKEFPKVPLKIKYLSLFKTAIEEVPSTICNLKSLAGLDLGGCRRLKNIPTSIYKLKPLTLFGLCYQSNKRESQLEANIHLRELTDQLVWLSNVENLNLSGSNFREIPLAIKELNNLSALLLEDCKRLQSLPQLPMNLNYISASNCISLETVASPLSTAAKGKFDSHRNYIWFNFSNCWKLDQNARNIIAADVESRLLHWEDFYPGTLLSQIAAANISFSGSDVLDWFNYKSSGSSLTAKLPPHWCKDELFSLVFCVVIEFNKFPRCCKEDYFYYNFHIRNNRGDSFHTKGGTMFPWRCENDIQSNQVFLVYDQSLVNNWGILIPEEAADEVDEISVDFWVGNDSINTVKNCGLHLLYTQDIEDRYRRSVVQPNFACGDLTQFSLKQDCVDDVEESVIQDAKDNVDNPVEDSDPVRRKKMKGKLFH